MKQIVSALFMAFVAAFLFGETIYMNEATASSSLVDSQGYYLAKNLIDRSWQTWAEGVRGSGIGEHFTLASRNYWDETGIAVKITAAGFALKNGYGNLDHYAKNNRVKAFKIYADGVYIETIAVKDSIGFEQYAFKTPITCTRLRFVIDDVYRGTEYDDTCIAEIAPLDEITGEDEFYENILFWLEKYPYEDSDSMYDEHDERIASLPDIDNDKALLGNYLPFVAIDPNDGEPYSDFDSKIARLEHAASLRLDGDLPRLDGATAMYPLYSAFVGAAYPKKEQKGDYIRSLLDWGYFPSFEFLYGMYSDWGGWHLEDFSSIVQCNTTPVAYERLINGEADIVFCYEPSEAEKAAAAAKGITLRLTPIAKDAFVFIVNDKNTLTNITTRQIRDIYSGRVTNWKSVSGVDEPVIAYQRPENSGSQTIFQTIMRGDTIARPILDGESVSKGMYSMIRKVSSDYYNYNAAIGYTFMFYLNIMAGAMGTKALAIDGIAPNAQSIKSGAYPFTQTVYAVTAGNESENTKVFIDWILSAEGQELVAKTGYVPVR